MTTLVDVGLANSLDEMIEQGNLFKDPGFGEGAIVAATPPSC